MNVSFHPEAKTEMFESAVYYQDKSPGLGFDFINDIENTIIDVERFPFSGVLIEDGIRRKLVRKFPFAVLYKINGIEIYILAIMHLNKKPEYWKNRNVDK